MKRQGGYSLLELTLSMAIGAAVITQTLGLYSKKIANQNFQISQLRLNQETQAMMNLVAGDIQRHGYWNGENYAVNPHATLHIENNCIILSYDKNKTGTTNISTNETVGYRLKSGKVQTRNSPTSCSSGRWESLNEVATIVVDSFLLTKSELGSCVNITHNPYSSCNSDNCRYQAYQPGDNLVKTIGINITMSAHLTQSTKQKIQFENYIDLPNPIIETALEHGPIAKENQNCT